MVILSDPVLFSYALITTAIILFILVYYVFTLADLECDYLNARECCANLNFWVIPKLKAHLILSIFILIEGHWFLFLLNAPMVIWVCYELYRLPTGNMGVYDPTEILSRGMLKVYLRNCMIYLAYYLIMFFIFLYCMISSLLKGNPIKRSEEDDIMF